MENIENSAITMGVFAHANAGKTTLTEQLLYHTKIIDTLGRVDSGNTTTDSLNIEKQRGISVRSALVTFELNDKKIQLIDTPGHIDFSAEVERTLNVLDSAIVVISGVEGVEAQTYTLWRLLKQKNIPTIIFINKMDRAGANYNEIIADIKKKIEKKVIPLINIEKTDNDNDFVKKEYTFEEMSETLAGLDDETLEKYLEQPPKITQEFLDKRLEELIKKGKIFPIIGGSALKNEGIETLISTMKKYLPSPLSNKEEKLSAFIYLVRVEDDIKNYFTKILSGNIKKRDIVDMEDGSQQKIKDLHIVKGIDRISVNDANSGDIVIINGINAECNQYIGEKPENTNNISFVNPLINMNVIAKDKNTSSELINALNILNLEDPYLDVRYDKRNNQIMISLMGEIQAQIIETMLKERFNIDAELVDPILIHKETPSKKGIGTASYTSVSSVTIEIKPLPTGSGVIYQSKFNTDFLLKKYQKQTERLIKQYLNQGVFGWEVTDAEISLIDGRFDSMGSDPMHFNIAVPLAFMRALKQCNMQIIEPIAKYNITIPKIYLNNVINNLSNLNSKFEIIEGDSEKVTLNGEAKYVDMLNFQNTLISITSGLGVYSSYISRYETSNNQDIRRPYMGLDPRNETVFLINEMKGSLDALDKPISKKKKDSSSKFKRQQKEAMYAKKIKDKDK
ncbi:MAG: translation factor GTPase family protein [Candidatus Absconditicoccaceae bacterium]